MKYQSKVEEALEIVENNCEADDYTVNIECKNNLATRYAQNAITQNIAGDKINFNIKVAYEDRTGSSQVSNLDEESLLNAIQTAQDIARMNEPDPEYTSSEEERELPNVDNYSEETSELNEEQLTDIVKKSVENAGSLDAVVSGFASRTVVEKYLKTKNGFYGEDLLTEFEHSMTIKNDDAETKVSRSVRNFSSYNLEDEISRLNSRLKALNSPEEFEAQKIPVILRAGAVYDLFRYLVWFLDQRNADEGASPFTDKRGERVFGEKFSILSVLDDPELSSPKFSSEGIPARETAWIKNGVLENMSVSRDYARKKGLEPNFLCNIFIPGEKVSEEEMITEVERGLIVNRLWYIRPVDRKKGELTGMTRDGVLYFEDGKIKTAVNNLRYNEIVHKMTERVLATGNSRVVSNTAKVPPILVDDFNFVDTTTF